MIASFIRKEFGLKATPTSPPPSQGDIKTALHSGFTRVPGEVKIYSEINFANFPKTKNLKGKKWHPSDQKR